MTFRCYPSLDLSIACSCRKTNWSKLSLRSEVYFQRRGMSFHLFILGVKSVAGKSISWRFRVWGVLFSVRIVRWFHWVEYRLNIVNQGIQSEKKLNVTSWLCVRLDLAYSGVPYDVMWDGSLTAYCRCTIVCLLLCRRPRLVDCLLTLTLWGLQVLFRIIGDRCLSLYFLRTRWRSEKISDATMFLLLHQFGFSSAESYLASTTLSDPRFKGLVFHREAQI